MCDLLETAVLQAQDWVEEDSKTAAQVVVVVAASVWEAASRGPGDAPGFVNLVLAQL